MAPLKSRGAAAANGKTTAAWPYVQHQVPRYPLLSGLKVGLGQCPSLVHKGFERSRFLNERHQFFCNLE
jgi:hypothetical protein